MALFLIVSGSFVVLHNKLINIYEEKFKHLIVSMVNIHTLVILD